MDSKCRAIDAVWRLAYIECVMPYGSSDAFTLIYEVNTISEGKLRMMLDSTWIKSDPSSYKKINIFSIYNGMLRI